MKNHYLFVPVIVLILLLSAVFGSQIMAQQKVVVIKKTTVSDSIISQLSADSMQTFIFKELSSDSAAYADCFEKFKIFFNDSAMVNNFQFEFDTILDPLNSESWQWTSGDLEDGFITVTEEGEEGMTMSKKQIQIMHQADDSNFIFVNTQGNDIQIERNGEMVFLNKKENVKDIDSQMEVTVDEQGQKVITIQTRIVLNDIENSKQGTNEVSQPNELVFEFIKLYPNPSTDAVNLSFKLADNTTTQVRISNSLGKTVYKEKLKNFKGTYQKAIELKQFGTGIYLIEIIQGDKTITRKVLIE